MKAEYGNDELKQEESEGERGSSENPFIPAQSSISLPSLFSI